MDTLYTFLDTTTHYTTKSVQFVGLMNSATKDAVRILDKSLTGTWTLRITASTPTSNGAVLKSQLIYSSQNPLALWWCIRFMQELGFSAQYSDSFLPP